MESVSAGIGVSLVGCRRLRNRCGGQADYGALLAVISVFPYVMLDIAVIVALARVFGWVARRFRQPAVIGEIVAGIALGPSLLGLLPGH
ncbi:MAG: cation:proton antiporter, partial [Mycobacterium sp.]